MVQASSSSSEISVSVPQTATLRKRQTVIDLLLCGAPLSDGLIALQCGVCRRTVLRLRHSLRDEGAHVALTDNRKDNGSEARYKRFWERFRALKEQFPGYGGRALWFEIQRSGEFQDDEMPVIGTCEEWLSRHEMVSPPRTAHTDKRPYYMDDYYKPMVRIGMDCQTVSPFGRNEEIMIVSVIDFYTRAVYSEAFPWNTSDTHVRGVREETFAGVLLRFLGAFGIPKVLVLDNGGGQSTQSGWISQVARTAMEYGLRVEWEPYGRPWRNGAVENWHRHSQRMWDYARHEIKSFSQAATWWRKLAWDYTTQWPQRKFKDKAAVAALQQCVQWPMDGPNAGPIAVIGEEKGSHEWSGTISFQREAESNGYVKLHGNDHLFVQSMLIGSYVRVDCVVMPRGEAGVGTVYDGKGNVVATFKHRFQCFRKQGESLIYDMNYVRYAAEGDVREVFYDQQARNREQERAHKNLRSKSDYEQTGSVPVMRSRKKPA